MLAALSRSLPSSVRHRGPVTGQSGGRGAGLGASIGGSLRQAVVCASLAAATLGAGTATTWAEAPELTLPAAAPVVTAQPTQDGRGAHIAGASGVVRVAR